MLHLWPHIGDDAHDGLHEVLVLAALRQPEGRKQRCQQRLQQRLQLPHRIPRLACLLRARQGPSPLTLCMRPGPCFLPHLAAQAHNFLVDLWPVSADALNVHARSHVTKAANPDLLLRTFCMSMRSMAMAA